LFDEKVGLVNWIEVYEESKNWGERMYYDDLERRLKYGYCQHGLRETTFEEDFGFSESKS
jgi:hypothetical protein